MINLKRNTKGEFVEAKGLRRDASIYKPFQKEVFKISRGKFSDFLACRRCFYLDRARGLISPSVPGWTLNSTTDILLKKEFDICRERQEPHRIFQSFGITNVVPFQHGQMDHWRDALRGGLEYYMADSNILLHGGIDDIWVNQETQQVIVADYKSQANTYPVTPHSYLSSSYHQTYKVQIDFYVYLLTNMGFDVLDTAYFYVCNANRNADNFNGKLEFEETLIPYKWDIGWIPDEINNMVAVLNSADLPSINPACENCAYSHQRSRLENN